MADHNIEINVDINGGDEAKKTLQDVQSTMDKLNGSHASMRLDVNSSGVDTAINKAQRLISVLQTASSVASSGASTLGNFGNMFADSFSAMSNMFSFDALGTAKRYLTAMATRAITSQISGTIQRYDIMNTFEDYMSLAGVDQFAARESLDAVDQSIRGIPIGLDEAAFRLRKYQMYMNDIDRATKFTIGIQKAITAGGASEQMKTTAYTQIDRLLATGKLGQSRQWLSLFNGLGVSLRFLREELALDPTADLKQIASDLASGTIATEDFIDAIARLADNEGLDKALDIYKGTIEAWRSNINNAIKRGGQNIMENINAVMEDTLGFGITGAMKQVRDGIDTVSKDAGNYIKNNPQNISTLSEAASGLIDRVLSLDGGRFVTNIVNNLSGLANAIGMVFDSLPEGFLEDFVSFATTWAGPMATIMTAAQSGLGVVLGVFERVKDMDMGDVISKITREIERMANIVSKLLGYIPDGLLGELMAMGLVWGRPLAKVFGMISSAFSTISTSLMNMSMGGNGGLLGIFLNGLKTIGAGPLIAIAGAFTAIAIGLHEAKEARDEWLENVDQKWGLSELEETVQGLQKTTDGITNSFNDAQEAWRQETEAAKINAEEAHKLLDEIIKTDEEMARAGNIDYYKNLYDSQYENIKKLLQLYPELSSALELDNTGRLVNAEALKAEGDAYIDYARKIAEANAASKAFESTYATYLEAQAQRSILEAQRRDVLSQIAKANSDIGRETYARAYLGRGGGEELTPAQYEEMQGWITAGLAAQESLPGLNESLANLNGQIDEIAITEEAAGSQSDFLMDKINGLNRETSEAAPSVQALKSIIDGAGKSAEESSTAMDTLFKGLAVGAATTKERLEGLITKYNEAKQAAQNWIDTALAGYEKMEAAGPELDENGNPKQTEAEWLAGTWNGMLEGEKSQVTEAGRYRSALNTIDQWYSGLEAEARQRYAPMVEEIISSPWEDRDMTFALAEKVKSGDWASVMELANKQLEEAALESGISDTIAHIMTADEESGSGMFGGVKDAISEGLLQTLQELTASAGAEGELGQATNNFTDTLLQPFEEGLMGGGEGPSGGGGGGVVGMFQNAMENIQESASELASTVSDALSPMTSGFDESTDGAHTLEAAISNLSSSASGGSGAMSSFAASLSQVSAAASFASAQVNALAAAINSLPSSKTITINLAMGGAVGGMAGASVGASAGLGWFSSTGGPIGYYAGGGFPGIGRGTDTVPAWLTPGEYVMKRSAVGLFGSRFMDRVNRMDIGGAFDALMSRIANPMLHGNTYNRDNHAQVNNYFYGNSGQDYSQRKAYRYVGSL